MRQGFESPTGYQLSQDTAAERQAVFLRTTPWGLEPLWLGRLILAYPLINFRFCGALARSRSSSQA